VKHFPKSLDTSVKGHNMFGASILTVACFEPVYNRFEIFRALLDGGAKLDEIRPNNGNVFHALAVRLLYSMLTLSPHNLTDSKHSLQFSRTYLFFFGLVKPTKKSSASWYVLCVFSNIFFASLVILCTFVQQHMTQHTTYTYTEGPVKSIEPHS